MADPLYELLYPYFDAQDVDTQRIPSPRDPDTINYLNRLSTLSLEALTTTEPQSLAHTSQSTLRSLQALSKRSHKSIIASADHLESLKHTLPQISSETAQVRAALPHLEDEAVQFAQKYSKSGENAILDRRRKAMLLARNVDRVLDVLELPSLLSSAIASSSGAVQGVGQTGTAGANTSYASALDLHAHIKRLHALYPNLELVDRITGQAEEEMKTMATNLVMSLQSQGIKLAGAMRTIGWLRRIAPELDETWTPQRSLSLVNSEGSLGALFLVCRLANLTNMLDALEPLRELADQETARRTKIGASAKQNGDRWSGGQQTERYLKRYIEIFREQSFGIISMYKSIFPSALPVPGSSGEEENNIKAGAANSLGQGSQDMLQPIPSALATFPLHLVELLMVTLREYLPNIQDRNSRDSLMTQVLYCAGSLGRLGGDFGMILSLLSSELEDEGEEESTEWVEVMKKHRVQASRLELLASGVGAGRVNS